MNRRLSGKEQSLNAPIGEDGDEWQDWVIDKEMDHELKIAQSEEIEQRKDLLQDSIKVLNDREKNILYSRRLIDNPITLDPSAMDSLLGEPVEAMFVCQRPAAALQEQM